MPKAEPKKAPKAKPADTLPALMAPDKPEPFTPYDETEAISPREYGSLQRAYDFFGPRLFGLALPDVLFAYQRRPQSGGHYAHERYASRGDGSKCSELVLNPDSFIGRDDRWIVSVFVHEMTHVWQFAHGKPSGNYHYHNAQWAAKMESIGLMPSNTGAVGGKRTGAKMSHYILKGGPFDQAFDELEATGWKLEMELASFRPDAQKKRDSKTKFVCEAACQIIRGKPSTDTYCGPCLRAILEELGVDVDAISPAKMLSAAQPITPLSGGLFAENLASTMAH